MTSRGAAVACRGRRVPFFIHPNRILSTSMTFPAFRERVSKQANAGIMSARESPSARFINHAKQYHERPLMNHATKLARILHANARRRRSNYVVSARSSG